MNDIKIKVNGMEIALENSSPVVGNVVLNTSELDNMSAMLAKESEDLSKQVKAVSLLSDIKTVESFGYKATEGVMDNAAKAAETIKNKLIEWFKKIGLFFQKLGQTIAIKIATMFKGQGGKEFGNALKAVSNFGFKLSKDGVSLASSPDKLEEAKRKQTSGSAVVSCVNAGIKLVSAAKNKNPNDKTIDVILGKVGKLISSIVSAGEDDKVTERANSIKGIILKQFLPEIEKIKAQQKLDDNSVVEYEVKTDGDADVSGDMGEAGNED